MTELTMNIASLLTGIIAACIYFSALWWTTSHMPTSSRPLTLYLSSLIVRMGALLLGMWCLIRTGTGCFVFAVVGFLIMRVAIATFTGISNESRPRVCREA